MIVSSYSFKSLITSRFRNYEANGLKTKKFRAFTAGNFSLLTNLIQTYEKMCSFLQCKCIRLSLSHHDNLVTLRLR